MSRLADRLRASFAAHPDLDDTPYIHEALDLDRAALVPAAVLVPIIDAPEPRVLLTVRNAGMRKHAGQVAFPGGRLDPEDDGPIAGALREAWEEVALPAGEVDVIGTARGFATNTGYVITPVVGVIPDGLALTPHEAEVATVFEVPFAHLFAAANHLERSAMFNGAERHFYEIDWPDQRIWGVTAGLIVQLAPRLRDAMGLSA